MSKQKTGPFDLILGKKIKNRRLELGMSQQKVAESIGVTYQQIQKYEHGLNRISTSRLQKLAQSLNTSINYFFSANECASTDDYNFPDKVILELAEEQKGYELFSIEEKSQVCELINCFSRIKDEKLRQNILNLAKSLKDY